MSRLFKPWRDYTHNLRTQIRWMMRTGMPLYVETGEGIYEPRILSYSEGKLMSRGMELPSATVKLDDDEIFIFPDKQAGKLRIGLVKKY